TGIYAGVNPDDEVRRASSSGGIFTLLAESVLAENGVVFGARFDKDWNVVHDYTDSKEGLGTFRGSKYVQSRNGETFKQAERFLKAGRKVLFSGTPCQIMGLKRYLRREYDNLLTVDFVCHGVPSPLVWRKYVEETLVRQDEKIQFRPTLNHLFSDEMPLIEGISFRDKCLGWKKYSFALTLSKVTTAGEKNTVSLSSIFYDNAYMQAFLANLTLRPSCHACPAKCGRSGSDVTLGDFWGIEKIAPELDDDRGCSLLIINNPGVKGKLQKEGCLLAEYPISEVIPYNPSVAYSVDMPNNRDFFWHMFDKAGFHKALMLTTNKAFPFRVLRKLFRLL
ncbi:F420H(2):quinone oxidoreductase, partial [Phocaeicola vulgatus]